MFQGVDIAAFVDVAKRDIVTVIKPFKVYHWSPGAGERYWQGKVTSGHDPAMLANAKKLGNVFWRTAGTNINSSNMYGNGLYAAVDPVATYSYAQGVDNFELIEFTVPTGIQYLNLAALHATGWEQGSAAKAVLNQFLCQNSNSGYSNSGLNQVDSFFENGGVNLNPKCMPLIKQVYKEILKVSGLAYSYSFQSFVVCEPSQNNSNNVAFVFFSGDWMNASNVELYQTRSLYNKAERRQIQTLFIGNQIAHEAVDHAAASAVQTLLTQNPSYSITGTQTTCNLSYCEMRINTCAPDGYTCIGQNLQLPLRVGPTILASEAVRTQVGGLLWSDLEGQAKVSQADTEKWLKTNRLGCDGSQFTTPTYPQAKATP